jgi:hypothetical protein
MKIIEVYIVRLMNQKSEDTNAHHQSLNEVRDYILPGEYSVLLANIVQIRVVLLKVVKSVQDFSSFGHGSAFVQHGAFPLVVPQIVVKNCPYDQGEGSEGNGVETDVPVFINRLTRVGTHEHETNLRTREGDTFVEEVEDHLRDSEVRESPMDEQQL